MEYYKRQCNYDALNLRKSIKNICKGVFLGLYKLDNNVDYYYQYDTFVFKDSVNISALSKCETISLHLNFLMEDCKRHNEKIYADKPFDKTLINSPIIVRVMGKNIMNNDTIFFCKENKKDGIATMFARVRKNT